MSDEDVFKGALELLRKADAELEKVGSLIRVKVPNEQVETFRGKTIFYLDTNDVRKLFEDEFKECAGAVAVIPWALDKARKAMEEGKQDEADAYLTTASISASYASTVCGLPELKEISDVIIHAEKVDSELVSNVMDKIVKKFGVEV